MKKRKNFIFGLASILLVFLFIELICVVFLYFRFRQYDHSLDRYSRFSATGVVIGKAMESFLPDSENDKPFERFKAEPYPFFVEDELQGYRVNPGRYNMTIAKRDNGKQRFFKYGVTINGQHQRNVGASDSPFTRRVMVFGDSWIFGYGVNDEQTFTYHLQQSDRRSKYNMLAMPGYSLTNSYLDFQKVKGLLGKKDVVVLGYADFYKIRHVAAPSRIRENGTPNKIMLNPKIKQLRAVLDSNRNLIFDYVPVFCEFAAGYCDTTDPTTEYMDDVTVKLINSIAEQTEAMVYMLHFKGVKSDPILKKLHDKVKVVSVLPEDFDYDMQDHIMDYDHHPGPYWHYAVYTKLSDFLRNANPDSK